MPMRADFVSYIKSDSYELSVESAGFPGGRIGGNYTEKLCEMTQKKTYAKRPLLPNCCVPDERGLLTGLKSGIFDLNLNSALAGRIFQRS